MWKFNWQHWYLSPTGSLTTTNPWVDTWLPLSVLIQVNKTCFQNTPGSCTGPVLCWAMRFYRGSFWLRQCTDPEGRFMKQLPDDNHSSLWSSRSLRSTPTKPVRTEEATRMRSKHRLCWFQYSSRVLASPLWITISLHSTFYTASKGMSVEQIVF